MTLRILTASAPGEIRVAAVRGDILVDYALWRPGAPDGVGDVHRGRVIAHLPAMAGAFIALKGAEGFLPDSAGAAGLGEGDAVTVRITRAAQGGKGPRLTTRDVDQAGTGPPALLRRGPNPAERLAALHPTAPVFADEAGLVASLRPTLGDRVRVAQEPWPDAVADMVDGLNGAELLLPGGARASVYPTPALVAIDVDGGASSAAWGGKSEVQDAVNRRLLPALARQIRLRNLSGAIVIDLAGLSVRRRSALGPAVAAALAEDPLRPRFLGFSALGLAEILRPRVHPPLHELQAGPHAAALAALRAVSSSTQPGTRPNVRAAPDVASALDRDPGALADLASRTGQPLIVRSDPALPPCAWVIEETGRD